MQEFLRRVPSRQRLLLLAPSQLDEILLACIGERVRNPDPTAARYISETELHNIYPFAPGTTQAQTLDADRRLMESFQRLQTRGLIVQASGQSRGMMTLTEQGDQAAGDVAYEEITIRQSLRREMLHSSLQGAAFAAFADGHYETAVLEAFVIVENAVRREAEARRGSPYMGNDRFGVRLMRAAFHETTGPLSDMTLSVAERQRIADLFSGAIGTFKNPPAHRRVGRNDPRPIIEELLFASRLLRYIA